GGRGWRDLWQDCLGLLLQDPTEVRELLLNNFAGVRIDGTNATVIGAKPGEFVADRNNINRVWMDHGAWPWFTTHLYLEQSGDYGFLLVKQVYFQDCQVCRGRVINPQWNPESGCWLREKNGLEYRGTVLEHLLVENLTAFFNVGEHNLIRLENADWNDALDMASDRGESVAFSAFYCYNLLELAALLLDWQVTLKVGVVEVLAEIWPLLDTLEDKIDYESVAAKQNLLKRYLASCQGEISGRKFRVAVTDLAADLRKKGEWLAAHIRQNEWISNSAGFNWFNGYYDNDGQRVEGDFSSGVRITLTGQVFTVMSGIAASEQVAQVIKTVDHYLKDPILGSYRLNTDFGGVQPNLGRAFGFAYGHKENGAVFCHMAVMYACALYHRGFVEAGYEVLNSLYRLAVDFPTSRIYPGIPEYFNQNGRGMYHYLTGAASWFLFAMLT
ncbi:MAG TPA: cellobiose phosphorylase, partial [Bacillota bacterium]|nr:cellobiose phosphorylase [Bacillota bacterium]